MNSCHFNPYPVYANSSLMKKGVDLSERMCEWYEIELITESDGGGMMMQNQFIPAVRGTVFVSTPGTIVRGVPPYHASLIAFDSVYDENLRDRYLSGGHSMVAQYDPEHLAYLDHRNMRFDFLDCLPSCFHTKNPDQIYSLLMHCFHLYLQQATHYPLYAKNAITQLIIALFEETENGEREAQSHSEQSVREIQRYLDAHFADPIDLAFLSHYMSMSREHVCRIFKRVTGRTLMDYLTSIRIFHAKELLLMTEMTNAHIAEQCGFRTEQSFYLLFRRHVGVTPMAYRYA